MVLDHVALGDIVSLVGESRRWLVVDWGPCLHSQGVGPGTVTTQVRRGRVVIARGQIESNVHARALILIQRAGPCRSD